MSVDIAPVAVALAEDEMWQGFIALRVVRKSLLSFRMTNGEVFDGFVTGLDEDWVSISTKDELKAVFISLANLASVVDTGETLSGLLRKNELSLEDVRRIEKYSSRTRASAHGYMNHKRELQEDERSNK